jgi:hypothetical protein
MFRPVTKRSQALVVMSNQGKTNTTGRIDEHGAFRHRIPELYLYSRFQLVGAGPPDFTPDYNDPRGGEWGYRKWYSLVLFPGGKDESTEMSYESKLRFPPLSS